MSNIDFFEILLPDFKNKFNAHLIDVGMDPNSIVRNEADFEQRFINKQVGLQMHESN